MEKHEKADPCYPFPSRFGKNGETIYSVPVEISSAGALETLGISFSDCDTLTFGSQQMLVYYFETTDKTFALDQRAWLNTRHTREQRYSMRHAPFERESETAGNPVLPCTGHTMLPGGDAGYEQVEADDLRDRMIAYVRERFAKNGLYADALALYLKNGYGYREIAEALSVRERNARFYLRTAKLAAREYCQRYVLQGSA